MTMPETIHIDHNNGKRKVCSCGGRSLESHPAIKMKLSEGNVQREILGENLQ